MKRSIQAGVVLVATAALLSACTTPGGGGGGDVPADGTAEIKAQELTVWVNAIEIDAVKNVYARFEEETGVDITIEPIPEDFQVNVTTRWAAGERPDILEYHATSLFWALNPEENLYDLSNMPYVERSGDLYDAAGSLNGTIYGAITDTPSLFGLFFNKDVLERNGIDVPETYEDLKELCATLQEQDPGVVPIWESGGSSWPTQILGGLMFMGSAQQDENWAQQVIDKETTFDAEGSPFIEALATYKELQEDGCFNPDATTARWEDSIPAVAQGTAAMVALPTGLTDSFVQQFGGDKAATSDAIGFAYPSADGAVSVWAPNVAGTWYVPKTGDAERESTALAFIDWATGDGYQGFVDEAGTFPIMEGADPPASGIEYLAADFKDAFEASTASAFNSNLSGFNAEFGNLMTGLLSGTETPESAAEKAQSLFEQAAKAAGMPGWE
jgi:raffinose/stachyose/melibiose transport system substrate-binding protein